MNNSTERSAKRRKFEDAESGAKIKIKSADQLLRLLQFRQTISPDLKDAINQFKDFLSDINTSEILSQQSTNLKILKKYCNAQTAASRDELDFPDLVSIWSLAVQSGNDSICSAVPAVLAQFYKTISGVLEFREFGLSLGHTLLKRDQVRLFDRGLSASRTREHLISPCLRLLTELVSFDGGALAGQVFDRRDIFFKRLDQLLDYQTSKVETDRRKPSIRRMALRFFVANLKFQDSAAKSEFITHGRILRNCCRGLISDGDDIVIDVLTTIENEILEDKDIFKTSKSRAFDQNSLAFLASLYNYEPDVNHPESEVRVRNALHDLLLKICTTKKGILLSQTGLYPVAFETRIKAASDDTSIDLGLDSSIYVDEYKTNIPVKNITLSQFVQSLKPENDTLQSSLLVQILRSAPELNADYFSKKNKLIASSTDDPTWRSQFAFLFSIIQLPVPRHFGWIDDRPPGPPPTSIIIESIIPRPFDRTVLSKYLTSHDEILVLSATRLLIAVLEKLQNVLKLFSQHDETVDWQQASSRLVEAVLSRLPKLQSITESLQRVRKSNTTLSLALSECFELYHRVLPEATIGSKFDVGPIVSNVFSQFESPDLSPENQKMLEDQLLHLLTAAQWSSNTKWWSKANSETMSLFTQVLQFVTTHVDLARSKVVLLLQCVISSAGMLSIDGRSFHALRRSLTRSKQFEPSNELWMMLDNALHRVVQRPVKYLDRIEAIQYMVSNSNPSSLLAVSIAEQWEFVASKYASQSEVLKNIAEWVVRFYSALDSVGENYRVVEQLLDDMLKIAKGKSNEVLRMAIDKNQKKPLRIEGDEMVQDQENEHKLPSLIPQHPDLTEVLGVSTIIDNSLEGLDHWNEKTDIELSIQSNKIAKLLQCTASPEDEIRRQSFQSLQTLTHIIEQSTYDEKVQLHLLLGEYSQTVRLHGFDTPIPSIVPELAVRILQIVADPAHKMYGKANKFLLRAPAWDLRRVLQYWSREILFIEPESDDPAAWNDEISWFVTCLVDGLRNAEDMEVYRLRNIFEGILVLYSKPGLLHSIRKLILTLIWRGICVGGADTLITRVGILEWLDVIVGMDKEHSSIISQLRKEIELRCDVERIQIWREDLPVLRTALNK